MGDMEAMGDMGSPEFKGALFDFQNKRKIIGISIKLGVSRKRDAKVEKEETAAVMKETTKVVEDDKEGASDDEFMPQSLFTKRP